MPIITNTIFTSNKIIKFTLSVTFIGLVSTIQAADLYQITDLGSLAPDTVSGRSTEAFAINDSNIIAGNSSGEDFIAHAVVHSNGQLTDLGFTTGEVIDAGRSYSFDINNNNVAVGYSVETLEEMVNDVNLVERFAVLYGIDNLTVTKIPAFSLDTKLQSGANAINDDNLVVGFGEFNPTDDVDDDGNSLEIIYDRGFFYNVDTEILTRVDPIVSENQESFQYLSLRDVNEDGYAVGISSSSRSPIDANRNLIARHVIGVNVNEPTEVEIIEIWGGTQQQPWAVNDAGKIVGVANSSANRDPQAFIYSNQSTTGLGFLNNNFKYSEAFDINESDQVVGISQIQNTPTGYHAFLYENDSLKDLNELIPCDSGWILNEARSINDTGMIVGTGILNGEKRAFMLTPQTGNKPICEVEDDSSDSGSIPVLTLTLLILFGFKRRTKI